MPTQRASAIVSDDSQLGLAMTTLRNSHTLRTGNDSANVLTMNSVRQVQEKDENSGRGSWDEGSSLRSRQTGESVRRVKTPPGGGVYRYQL